jgi:hypothetical protein
MISMDASRSNALGNENSAEKLGSKLNELSGTIVLERTYTL